MRTTFVAICAALTACADASMPNDVEIFIKQRDACEHFSGEFPDPPDPEQREEILKMIAEHCTGTDARLVELRTRYQANAKVMKKLSEYEMNIEATEP